jgi:two-component system, chemotaxis family, chemotaxis protein CheY
MTDAAEIDWNALRIICINNDQEMRHVITNILRDLGVGSTPMAKNGGDGYYEIENSSVDMVILDSKLDGGDGLDFVRKLRDPASTPAPYIPVIMMSTERSLEVVTHAIKQGVDHYMVKPIVPKDLGASITNMLTKPPLRIKTETYVGPCRRRLPQRVYGRYDGPDRRSEELGD